MGIKINELPATPGINKEDVLIVEDGQGTKKGTVQQLDEALGVSQLKEDIADTRKKIPTLGKNRYYYSANIVYDKYLELGEEKAYEGWAISDYIDISGIAVPFAWLPIGSTTMYPQELNNVYGSWYDESKNRLKSFNGRLHLQQKPERAKYLRISQATKYIADADEELMICDYTELPTEYIPFAYKFDVPLENEYKNRLIFDDLYSLAKYNKNIKSISRLGYRGENSSSYPEQSIESYKQAVLMGFDTLICDLRFTKDKVPVCLHDETINRIARNSDGSEINTSINILDLTMDDVNAYDFGIYISDVYKNTKILTLKEMCMFAKKTDCELYIEIKDSSQLDNIALAVNIIRATGMSKRTSWFSSYSQRSAIEAVKSAYPPASIGLMPDIMSDTILQYLISLKTDINKCGWFAWDTSVLSDDVLKKLIENDLFFEVGTLNDKSQILDYLKDNYMYCTGISSDLYPAGKIIRESVIK